MEKTKRILLIASRPLSCDGLTKIEIDIINRFYKEIEFSVACAWDFDNEYGNKLKKLKLDLFKLPAKKNVFQYFAAIFKLVKRKKFDAVYVHGNSAMMIMEALPAKIAGCPQVITHCHNTKSNFPIVHYLAKPLFNYVVDVKIGCSSYAAKWAYFGKKVKVVNNGINVEKCKFNAEICQHVRQQLGFEDNFVIGHVGRMNPQKNHEMLLDIFKEYQKYDDSAKMLLIGDGELKEQIQNRISKEGLDDKVVLIEHTDNVQDYYQAMNLMVMPSLYEGLCLVALEAQANGIPLLISDRCAPETAIVPETQFLSLNDGVEAWVSKIRQMKKDTRNDNYSLVKNTWADEDRMMLEIEKILVS